MPARSLTPPHDPGHRATPAQLAAVQVGARPGGHLPREVEPCRHDVRESCADWCGVLLIHFDLEGVP